MKHIVILGAGFGGLRAAFVLGKGLRAHNLCGEYDITLVDRNSYHTYTPLLYEVATTSPETVSLSGLHEVAAYAVHGLVSDLPVRFLQDDVTAIDTAGSRIMFRSGEPIQYEYLVMAAGAEQNFFDIPGLKEHALPLKTFADALAVRDAIRSAVVRKRAVSVVVGGAGPTGVELAGELKSWCGELSEELPSCAIDITLLQGPKTILEGFPAGIVARALARLKKLGVHVRTNARIVGARESRLALEDGSTVPFDVCVWTGGIKASELVRSLSIKTESRGRAEVQETMECVPHNPTLHISGKVYAIGDAVCVLDPQSGMPMPGVARAAIVQGGIAAMNILSSIRGGATKKYHPRHYPYIIPIGGKYAIAKIGPVVVSGFLGWTLKGLVELNYLLSIMPAWRAFKTWIKGLLIFVQNDRLG